MISAQGPTISGRFHFTWGPARAFLWLILLITGWVAPLARAQTNPPVSLVSVLVLYTPQAAAGAGGTSAMLGQINEAVVEANTVFQNSRVNARFYLAKAALISYAESGSVSNDLARLRSTNDPVFKQAHLWRDQYAADLVCLITETGKDYEFYGLQGPSSESAFSILRQPYLAGFNYLPVTLSFNFGCQLESGYADSVGAFPYAYGYSFWDDTNYVEYSTVEGFNGERLPFFSNPDIPFAGQPAGIPAGLPGAADNALVLNQTAPIVATFRGTAVTTQPPAIRLTYPADGAVFWSGTNIPLRVAAYDSDGTVVSVAYYLDTTNLIASASSGSFNGLWAKAGIGVHALVAVATDNQHATTTSDPVSVTVLPVNDDFANRTAITLPAVIQEPNDLASAETNEPDNNGNAPSHSLWWTCTAPSDTYLAITVSSNSIPLNISVFTGTNLVSLTNVTATGYAPGDPTSLLFRAAAGTSYQITADSQYGGPGNVDFTLSRASAPPNDDFAQRTFLRGNAITVNADNTYATHELGEPAQMGDTGSSDNASLWWSWTAPANGQVTLTAANDTGEFLLAGVFTGNSITNLTLVADETSYGPGSDFVFDVQAGTNYQIVIDDDLNYGPYPGPFSFTLDFVPPSANQFFNNRTKISGSWISLTNALVSGYGDPFFDSGLNAVWWSWTAPASGWVTLSTGTYDWIDVFTGTSLATLTGVPLNDYGAFYATRGVTYTLAGTGDSEAFPLQLVLSTVQLTSPASGAICYVGKSVPLTTSTTANDGNISQVQYFANGTLVGTSRTPPYRVNWRPTVVETCDLTAIATDSLGHPRISQPVWVSIAYPPPANDNFANRTSLQGTWLSITNSNLGATREPGEPDLGGIYGDYWGNSVWWTWTATASGIVTLSSANGDGFGVYTGTELTNLTEITNGFAPITFTAVAGTVYAIGAIGPDGDVTMELSLSNLKIGDPVDGSTFTNGSNLSLQALPTATEQPVRQIEFFANGTLLGIATNSPYLLEWTNVPGADYALVAVAIDTLGHDRSSPPVNISLHPENDNFTNRTRLQGDWISVTNATANATDEPGEPGDDQYFGAGSIWWQWTAPASGWVTVDLPGEFGYVGVYQGHSLSTLRTVAGDYSTTVEFATTGGSTYFIAAATWYDPAVLQLVESTLSFSNVVNDEIVSAGTNLLLCMGNSEPGETFAQVEYFINGSNPLGIVTNPPYNFVWTNVPPGNYSISIIGTDNQGRSFPAEPVTISVRPPNDDFARRTVLEGIPLSVAGTTANASVEDEPNLNFPGEDHTVWYSWTSPIPGEVQISATSGLLWGEEFPPFYVGIYTGDLVSHLEQVLYGMNSVIFSATAGVTYQIQVDGDYNDNSAYDPDFTLYLAAEPTNTVIANAIPVTGNNAVATGDNSFTGGGSLWYSWTALAQGHATIAFSGNAGFACAAYSGSSTSNLTEVADITPSSWVITNTFATVAGTTYWFKVTGGPGLFSLDITLSTVPGNDLFANRTPLSGMRLVATGTTLYATSELGEPNPFGGEDLSVWYAWTAPTTGFVRIRSPDAFLAVFTGNEVSNLITVATGGFQNEVDFDAQAGQTYPIAVIQEYSYDPDTFGWSLSVAKVAITNPVAGTVLPPGTNVAVEASTIDLDGAVTSVAFYANTNLLGVITNPPFNIVISNLAQGYYVLSAQATDQYGGITTSKSVDMRVPPWNDDFTNRITFTGTNLALAGDNSGATSEPGEYLPGGASGRTLWWSWTAPTNGLATLVAPNFFYGPFKRGAGSAAHKGIAAKDLSVTMSVPPGPVSVPLMAVYTGSALTNLSLYASNTTFFYFGYGWQVQSSFSFFAYSGQTYQISLDGVNGGFGSLAADLSFVPIQPPVNDNFAQRTVLMGADIVTNGTTIGATVELSDPDLGSGMDARTVWYSWSAPASGTVEMETFPLSFSFYGYAQLGVYAGSTPANLIPVASGGDYSSASFYALAGTRYQIEVATPSGHEETFSLSLHAPTPFVTFPTNAVKLRNGTYDIHVIGSVGQSFVIQYSANNLIWTTIDTDTLQSSSFDYVDTTPRSGSTRYYRVLPLDTVLNNQPFHMLPAAGGTANGFTINLTGISGLPVQIQSSTNLVNWFNLSSGVLINNAFNFTDYNAPNVPIQFYRTIQQ